jgi:hypothetical protein
MTPPRTRHPDFESGNTLALIHGADSARAIEAQATVVHEELLSIAPYLAEEKFIPAVHRYLRAAAREALLDGHIADVSAEKGPGAVSSRLWEQATAATRLAAKLASDLGLDPIGHARIRALSTGADLGQASLDTIAADGRAARQRRAGVIDAEAVTDDGSEA